MFGKSEVRIVFLFHFYFCFRLDLDDQHAQFQSDIQLLGGRPDGLVLAAWLTNKTSPQWRLVSVVENQPVVNGNVHNLKSIAAQKSQHTKRLLSLRAADRETSFLITIDTPINTTVSLLC